MYFTDLTARLDRFRTEATIALCSIWASVFMFWYPTDFDNFPLDGHPYVVMQLLIKNERWWAGFIFVAALTKIFGLLALLDHRYWGVSLILRKLGLTMSFIWWTILGISAMIGGYFILGFLPLIIGLTSAWVVMAATVFPV